MTDFTKDFEEAKKAATNSINEHIGLQLQKESTEAAKKSARYAKISAIISFFALLISIASFSVAISPDIQEFIHVIQDAIQHG